MIPYEELVSALAQWRARNGLATEAESFLAGPAPSVTGAVHAALPLGGGEIVDLEEDGALEEVEAYDEEVESALAGIGGDPEPAAEAEPGGEGAYADAAAAHGEGYDYGYDGGHDDAAAYAEAQAPAEDSSEVLEVDDDFEVESVAADDAGDFAPLDDEATAFSQMPEAPEAPETPDAESTRVGAMPDFADPDDPANRSE